MICMNRTVQIVPYQDIIKMKKQIIITIFILLINLVFADINSDLEYMQNILQECYVNYDINYKKGYKPELAKKTIKYYYKYAYKQNESIQDKKERESISLVDAISWGLEDTLLIPDGHLNIKYKDYAYPVFSLPRDYFTGVFIEEKEGNFLVYEDINGLVKKGLEYDDDSKYLRRCIHQNREMYQIVIQTTEDLSEIDLQFENEKISLPCICKDYNNNTDFINYKKTNKNFYVSIGFCPYLYDETSEYEQKIKNIVNEINMYKEIDNFIIDLRSNAGGFSCFEYLIPRLLCSSNEKQAFEKILPLANRGKIELISPDYLYNLAKYYEEAFPDNTYLIQKAKNEYIENRNNKKYYKGLAEYPINNLPPLKIDRIKNNIIVLIDKKTASQAEYALALLYLFGKEKIILVGENSRGSLEVSNILGYSLPDSKVKIFLGNTSAKNTSFMHCDNNWKGELIGFEPDYWTFSSEEIIDTLIFLTNDKEIGKLGL